VKPRYLYLGTAHTDPALCDLQCDPVKDARGKCVVSGLRSRLKRGVVECGCIRIEVLPCVASPRSMGSALVVDEAGTRYVVSRRRLRVNRCEC
jgi:hypothetical protein